MYRWKTRFTRALATPFTGSRRLASTSFREIWRACSITKGNFRRRKTYLRNMACLLADSYAGNGQRRCEPKGNLLVDRVNGEVFRCELFNADGSIRLQSVFTNYATYNECRIPQRVDVRWRHTTLPLALPFLTLL